MAPAASLSSVPAPPGARPSEAALVLALAIDAEPRVRHGVQARLGDDFLAALAQPEGAGLDPIEGLVDLRQRGLVALQELEAEFLREALGADVRRVVDREPVTVRGEGVGLEVADVPGHLAAELGEDLAEGLQVALAEFLRHADGGERTRRFWGAGV